MGVIEGVFKVKLHWSVYGGETRREGIRRIREGETWLGKRKGVKE